MAEENLDAVIRVIDRFSEELDRLIRKLGEIEAIHERVDNLTIDVDVDDAEVDALMAKLAATDVAAVGVGDIDAGGGGRVAGDVAESTAEMAEATTEATSRLSEFDLRMTDIHNALARLVPLLFTVIGSIPALYGAFIGLAGAALAAAAALTALTAFGALGVAMARGDGDISAGFVDMAQQVQEDFMDAFAPLAERLAPLFRDALDGLDMLFQAIASRGDVLVQMADAARDLGSFILDTFPAAIAMVGRIATAFLPVFEHLMRLLVQRNIGRGFVDFMAQVLPPFIDFVSLVADFIPHLLGMSIGFLRVTNAILLFLDAVVTAITFGGVLNQELGFLIGTILTLVTATLIWNSALIGLAKTLAVNIASAVLGAVQAFTSYDVAAFLATLSTWQLVAAVAALATAVVVATGGLVLLTSAAASAASDWFNLGGGISAATQKLREFDRVSGRVDGANPYGPSDTPSPSTVAGGTGGGDVAVDATVESEQELNKQLKNANYRLNTTT